MNNIYTTSISNKRQTGEFIIKKEHFSHKEIKEIVYLIRDVFEMRGLERVSKEMKGFLHNYPNGSYVKFTLKLDHDFSVISSGGGLLGYISDSVYDAYDTFVFSNVDCFIPPGYHLKSIDELKSKWTSINQIVSLYDYKQDPSILTKQPENPKLTYGYQPRQIQPLYSPKQIAQQHTAYNQQMERDALSKISLSSSPNSSAKSTSLKSKVIKENGSLLASSPPISVRGF